MTSPIALTAALISFILYLISSILVVMSFFL